MSNNSDPLPVDVDWQLLAIAQDHLMIETLEVRNMDGLDFHDVSVIGVRRALMAAYQLGLSVQNCGTNR